MSLLNAMRALQSNKPQNEERAQKLLNSLPQDVQEQLIAAIYIGREHIHSNRLRTDVEISRRYTDQIPQEDYARIIYEKANSLDLYFKKLEECAKNSGFDIETI